MQAVGDEALAGQVDVGDEIVGVRLPAVDRQCGPLAYLQPAGLAGEFDGRRARRPEIGLEHLASLPHRGVVNHLRISGQSRGRRVSVVDHGRSLISEIRDEAAVDRGPATVDPALRS